jgi:DNA-binding transcriptional MerR regulator
MKDWLTIGQFSKRIGVSAKALRIYEKMGLLKSHTRGDNGYRYYQKSQVEIAYRLKDFKDLGFTLNQIKSLLSVDTSLDSEKLAEALSKRLEMIAEQERDLSKKKSQVERILTSLKQKTEPLEASERKYIMSIFDKISVVITGVENLEQCAQKIQRHLSQVGLQAPIIHWDGSSDLSEVKPAVLVIPENQLTSPLIKKLTPDVVVINNASEYSESLAETYLNVFQGVGPHMTTIFNADDESSVKLAGLSEIQKGRIYYHTKNSNLEKQIRHIGGVLGDGSDITVYGFNGEKHVQLKLAQSIDKQAETVLMASIAAVMDLGLPIENFQMTAP